MMKRLLLSLLFAGQTSQAQAARPMITDDARLVDPKSCQIESWVRYNRDSEEYWALPGCNFTGNLELTLGGAYGKDSSGSRTTDIVFQAKTLLRPLETNNWGMGLTLGNVNHPAIQTDSNLLGDVYLNLPASFSFADDRFVLHTNVGMLHDKPARTNRGTWGLGSETRLSKRTWLIAETYGQDRSNPFYQLGLRYWLIPDRVQIDTTYGNRIGEGDRQRWFSIGLRLLSPAFLP